MQTDVVLLPRLLEPQHLENRAVVVLDVLRATTTMAAALGAGARGVRTYASTEEVRRAASVGGGLLSCGEERCLRPEGFDLGNSPAEFVRDRVEGKTILMSTTNGTRAIVAAARGAAQLYAAALVNAEATARHLARQELDVALLCAGTGGDVALEDVIGAGAIIVALNRLTQNKLASDAAQIALALFEMSENSLPQTLRSTQGGRNVVAARLEADIDYAARPNVLDVVARVDPRTLTVTRANSV
jgi:2-phosphosulfolactate phosphatase